MAITAKNSVEIGTVNPKPYVINNSQFIEAPYDIVRFRVNPESVQITQQNISKLERVESGYVKIAFDSGLITVAFAGKMPLYFENEKYHNAYNPLFAFPGAQDEVDPMSNIAASQMLETSPSWRWFQEFSDFVRGNNKYPFLLSYYGIITQMKGINPVLKGDITPPAYSQDAQNPFILNYNFTFNGILLTVEQIIEQKSNLKAKFQILNKVG